MQIELKRIQTEVGITFIYVTHDQEEAMTMSDRIAVMRGGRIEQLGDPEEPLRAAGDGVRGRIPWLSNLLDGEVAGRDGDMVAIRLSTGRWSAPRPGDPMARTRSVWASGRRSSA